MKRHCLTKRTVLWCLFRSDRMLMLDQGKGLNFNSIGVNGGRNLLWTFGRLGGHID